MASPPFSLSTTTPGDSDIVSQFPLNERTVRDITQSWLLANHDTNGNHVTVTMPYQGSAPATPSASLIKVYADVNGRLKIVYPDGTIGWVGLPPGSIIFMGVNVTPVGYLVADGSAVSRATFSDLFGTVGTLWGAGNGSTTFNIPNLIGRVPAGEDPTQSVIGAALWSGVPATIATYGGQYYSQLSPGHLPSYTPTGSVSTLTNINYSLSGGSVGSQFAAGNGSTASTNFPGTGTFVGNNNGGTSAIFQNMQPTTILRALVKY